MRFLTLANSRAQKIPSASQQINWCVEYLQISRNSVFELKNKFRADALWWNAKQLNMNVYFIICYSDDVGTERWRGSMKKGARQIGAHRMEQYIRVWRSATKEKTFLEYYIIFLRMLRNKVNEFAYCIVIHYHMLSLKFKRAEFAY